MPHVVLIGDSIFDNAAYVAGAPDVVAQLTKALPTNWDATLVAVDGARTGDVSRQLGRIPESASHLVISVGGNDALGFVGILDNQAPSAPHLLDQLGRIRDEFDAMYKTMLDAVAELELPTTLCTIYRGALPDAVMQRRASVALAIFNEVILEHAFARAYDVIDLRAVCCDPEDYANPIEPSERGGEKIARTIALAVTDTVATRRTTVFSQL